MHGTSSSNPAPRSLSYEDALAAVLDGVDALGVERVALEASLDRALAESVHSTIALPRWDNAGMDGIAVRRADVRGASRTAPRRLPLAGTVAAGADPASIAPLAPGHAVRVMTGAPIPAGTEAVVRVEDTGDAGEPSDAEVSHILVFDDRDLAGTGNVRPRGEEIAEGATLFSAGTSIRPPHLGVLASVGVSHPLVHRRPRVAILAGGDELALLDAFDEVRAGRRIIASSSYALPPLLRMAGAETTLLPLVADTLDATTRAIETALASGIDLLITTGGVSVGAHDHTRAALEAVGGTLRFWRARLRPGGPFGAGRVGSVPWLGLPGNPVSTMVTGWLFAAPVLRRMGGHRHVHHRRVRVRMTESVATRAPLAHFLRASLQTSPDGVLEARLAGPQGSNLLRTLADADALLHVPEAVDELRPGDVVDAIPLPGAWWAA